MPQQESDSLLAMHFRHTVFAGCFGKRKPSVGESGICRCLLHDCVCGARTGDLKKVLHGGVYQHGATGSKHERRMIEAPGLFIEEVLLRILRAARGQMFADGRQIARRRGRLDTVLHDHHVRADRSATGIAGHSKTGGIDIGTTLEIIKNPRCVADHVCRCRFPDERRVRPYAHMLVGVPDSRALRALALSYRIEYDRRQSVSRTQFTGMEVWSISFSFNRMPRDKDESGIGRRESLFVRQENEQRNERTGSAFDHHLLNPECPVVFRTVGFRIEGRALYAAISRSEPEVVPERRRHAVKLLSVGDLAPCRIEGCILYRHRILYRFDGAHRRKHRRYRKK